MEYDDDNGKFVFSLTVDVNEKDLETLRGRLVNDCGIYLCYGFQGSENTWEGSGELYLGKEGEFLCDRFPSLEWCCVHGGARDEDYAFVDHNDSKTLREH